MKSEFRNGYVGGFGGCYVPDLLASALEELRQEYDRARKDASFREKFNDCLKNFAGRPTPLIFAERLTKECRGARVFLKNEGANHTGAHKITHCIGQAIIAQRLGKKMLIAETGAGQHGLATATVAAKFGLKCKIFMGEVDMERQRPNVFFMERLGATVVPVTSGSRTLKDAVGEALRHWIKYCKKCHYVLGSALGPDPFPRMNRDFQAIVGREARKQLRVRTGRLPDYVVACVGGGSNALGIFTTFIPHASVKLIGVEAGGKGVKSKLHAARFRGGSVGVFEGFKSYFLQDGDGNMRETHSIAAGLDYPGIGPELAALHDNGRVTFTSVTDKVALKAVEMLARYEGIIPALESAHAVAHAMKLARTLDKTATILVNISGRGEKDMFILARQLRDEEFRKFLKKEGRRYE